MELMKAHPPSAYHRRAERQDIMCFALCSSVNILNTQQAQLPVLKLIINNAMHYTISNAQFGGNLM
jgi:hypothetical protein